MSQGVLANLAVVIGTRLEGLQRGLRQAERDTIRASRNMQRAFGPLGTMGSAIGIGLMAAGAAAAAGFGAMVTSGIKANASLEQYQNTLNTVMGDSKKAAETLDWVRQYAAKTPFELPGLIESTVKLQAMGLEAQKFIPVAADMAAVFQSSGKTVSDAAEAINDAVMGRQNLPPRLAIAA